VLQLEECRAVALELLGGPQNEECVLVEQQVPPSRRELACEQLEGLALSLLTTRDLGGDGFSSSLDDESSPTVDRASFGGGKGARD